MARFQCLVPLRFYLGLVESRSGAVADKGCAGALLVLPSRSELPGSGGQ